MWAKHVWKSWMTDRTHRRHRERRSGKKKETESHEQQRNCAMVFSARSTIQPFLIHFGGDCGESKYSLQLTRPMVRGDSVAAQFWLPTRSRTRTHTKSATRATLAYIRTRRARTHTSRTIRRISYEYCADHVDRRRTSKADTFAHDFIANSSIRVYCHVRLMFFFHQIDHSQPAASYMRAKRFRH